MPSSTSSSVLCFVGVGRRSSGVGVGSEGEEESVESVEGASGEVSLVSPVVGVIVSVAAFLAARRALLRDMCESE